LVSGRTGFDFAIHIIAVKERKGVERFLGIARIAMAYPKKPKKQKYNEKP
jgi:hypothetical protein